VVLTNPVTRFANQFNFVVALFLRRKLKTMAEADFVTLRPAPAVFPAKVAVEEEILALDDGEEEESE
jgi:hypothetical protein